MNLSTAVTGQTCRSCETTVASKRVGRCPDCESPLTITLDTDAIERGSIRDSSGGGMERFAAVLPVALDQVKGHAVGDTPTISLPGLGSQLGVGTLGLKDEGRNPTGALADRWATIAVGVATARDAGTVSLPSPGHGGQAVAAQAATAGLNSHAFLPGRAPFVTKAMINVHGGDMTVVPGRYADAAAAYATEANTEWFPAGPFATAFPVEGAKTVAYELATSNRGVPDTVVVPVGHGTAIVGLEKGFTELERIGVIDALPRLVAVQPVGCSPVVTAWADDEPISPVEAPDTISGPLEIPNPAGARLVLESLERTDGTAISVTDTDLLAAAVELTEAGVTAGTTGGATLAAVQRLVREGQLSSTDDVVCLNTISANKEADVLRSHLMSTGV